MIKKGKEIIDRGRERQGDDRETVGRDRVASSKPCDFSLFSLLGEIADAPKFYPTQAFKCNPRHVARFNDVFAVSNGLPERSTELNCWLTVVPVCI